MNQLRFIPEYRKYIGLWPHWTRFALGSLLLSEGLCLNRVLLTEILVLALVTICGAEKASSRKLKGVTLEINQASRVTEHFQIRSVLGTRDFLQIRAGRYQEVSRGGGDVLMLSVLEKKKKPASP